VAPASAYGRAALAPADEVERLSLASLRLAVARAEPGATEALRRFAARYEEHGLDPGALVQSWGLADPAMTASLGSPGRPLVGARVDAARLAAAGEVVPGAREVTPAGQPLPGVALEVRDDAGAALPPGRLGHLWLRAPEQLQGTGAEGPDGWLDTGDLGFVLEGTLYLHARREDLVRIRGARHAPDEFEAPLHGLPGIGAAVALTLPPDRAEAAADGALLVLAERAAGEADDAALAAAVGRAVLARAGVAPHTVQILPPGTLPRTGTGRLRRGEALRRWRDGTLSPPRGVNPVRLALDAARSQLAWVRVRLRG
jgi:acyl-CoA synthetase (AMP-forming)/AMP-acid ligase II